MDKRLFRSRSNQVISGLCAGIGDWLNVDPTVIRLLTIALVLFGGCGILCYLIGWIIIPEEPIV